MKTFLILFIASITLTNAQINKGDIAVFAMASPFPSTQLNENDFGLISAVGVEYYFSPKLSLATQFIASNNTLFVNNSKISLPTVGIVPTLQYYLYQKSNFNINTSIGLGFANQKDKFNNLQNSLTIYTAGVGGHYFFSEKWALKLHFPYMYVYNQTQQLKSLEGIGAFIGFHYQL